MNLTELYVMAQSEVEKPSLFPFDFKLHIVFTIIAVIFLIYRFMKQKQPYQLIMAIATPILLLLWVSESRTLFYTVGVIEFVLILAAIISSIVISGKNKKTADSGEVNTK